MTYKEGIITQTSPYEVVETIDRLVAQIEKKGGKVYCRIDQQSEAQHAGKEILPLVFILFGDPAKGADIMAANAIAALDLPLKIIVWKDTEDIVRISFNDIAYIQKRYDLPAVLMLPVNLSQMIAKALI